MCWGGVWGVCGGGVGGGVVVCMCVVLFCFVFQTTQFMH